MSAVETLTDTIVCYWILRLARSRLTFAIANLGPADARFASAKVPRSISQT